MAEAARKRKSRNVEAAAIEQIALKGVVVRKRFHNAQNGYCVLVVETGKNGSGDPFGFGGGEMDGNVTMVGNMPVVREGDEYLFKGSFTEHPQWGKQFKFSEAELILPSGKAGVARYLSQVTFGVGIKKAERIVQALGDDALERIKGDPGVLDCEALSFLDERQKGDIVNDLAANGVQAELAGIICVPGNGVGMGTVAKIMNKYGAEAVKVVKENPYLLSDDLFGVGFKKADVIGMAAGVEAGSPFRVEAALDYILKEAGNEGHVYLEPNDIVGRLLGRNERGKRVKGLLEGSGVQAVPDIRDANLRLITNGKCVRDGDSVYSRELFEAEVVVAGCVRNFVKAGAVVVPEIDKLVDEAEAKSGIEYAKSGIEYAREQKQAVKMALTQRLSVVCGGPGTGKSTISKAICDIYSKLYPRNEIYLAAPTGRAAKRLGEATGRENEARTIHRLLSYNPSAGGFMFTSRNQLPSPGLVLIDEFSMVDIELAASLLSALDEDMQVVIVGDPKQLPSVGAGSVLRDLIACENVPTVKLAFNYRQANGSVISQRANLICDGTLPGLDSSGDWTFIPVEGSAEAAEAALELVKRLKGDYGLLDWLCLAPMYRGSAGITALNDGIRDIINPKTGDADQKELCGFRAGDKILCTRNIYALGCFNGDLGVVKEVEKGEIVANFGDNDVRIPYEHLESFKAGYALSVHKAQGSEVPVVVMVLTKQSYVMLTNEVFYTGVTRARDHLYVIAEEAAIKLAVKNNKVQKRFSKLAERIRGK